MTSLKELEARRAEILEHKKKSLEKKAQQLRFDLPHLYSHKLYRWQRAFIDSENRMNIVCAANQIGKSSGAIRRLVANATDEERRKKIFPATWATYRQQWYFYPDSKTLEREWATKWQEYMPRGAQKASAKYGWHVDYEKAGVPKSIRWNSGVTTYFLYYSKHVSSIQASSPHEIFCDEEMPTTFYDEIMMRMISTAGVFNMCYTPTLNQAFWKRVMQKKTLKSAFTQEVSMYECLEYEDGSPSTVFSREMIAEVEAKCQNEAERQRRVYGKHVVEGGRVYYGFDEARNVVASVSLSGYQVYAAIDYGSGGEKGHPAAIVFCALSADGRQGYVFKCWRGDGVQTSAGDIVNKFIELKKGLNIVDTVYDHSAKDLSIIATRSSIPLNKANKAKDFGEEILNTLLLSGSLKIFEFDDGRSEGAELLKLSDELSMLMVGQLEGDDLTDALRYCVCAMPWDFEHIKEKLPSHTIKTALPKIYRPMSDAEYRADEIKRRRGEDFDGEKDEGWGEYNSDIQEFNEIAGSDE